jgi:hypothetical protein
MRCVKCEDVISWWSESCLCNVIYWITLGFDGDGHIIDTHLTLKGDEGIKTQEK